ncbi:MAG: response regulator [Pseudomonadota bacterium]
MSSTHSLAKPVILLAEDHWLISLHACVLFEELGCKIVGPATSLEQALAFARTEVFDAAILDVFLGDETCFPLADLLADSSIPFAFATGSTVEMLPETFQDRPYIEKPYTPESVRRVLTRIGPGANALQRSIRHANTVINGKKELERCEPSGHAFRTAMP